MKSFFQFLHLGKRHVPQAPLPPATPQPAPGSPAARHSPPVVLAHLPHRHHRAEMRDVGTQTDSEDFAPVYQQVDHRRTRAARANQAFEAEVELAARTYRKRVHFEPVMEDGNVIGYIASAPRHAAKVGKGQPPVLMVAGSGSVSRYRPTVVADTGFFNLRAPSGPTGIFDIARKLRRGEAGESLKPGGTPMPNFKLGSSRLTPMQAAAFLNDAGRSHSHGQAVDVFIPASGVKANLSTLLRQLSPGRYAGIGYAHG